MNLVSEREELATLPVTRVWDTPQPDSAEPAVTLAGAGIDMLPASSLRFRLVDQAYEEFCRLEEEGAGVDPDEFCARYPVVHSSLARLLQAHRFLADNSQLLPEEGEPAWPSLGQEWAGFRLLRELGRGAFARVYQAEQPAMGNRLVALKVSPQGDAEAATLGPLEHPGIVSAYSVTRECGLWAVCMPYRGSATLVQVLDHFNALRQGKQKITGDAFLKACEDPFADQEHLPALPEALRDADLSGLTRWLATRLTEALLFIHRKGIHHRDLKPSNILLQPDGTPLLLDFNLSADTSRKHNRLGGTPLYMAPEQLAATTRKPGEALPLDARSDIFALGVILYEIATGKHPYGPIPLKFSTSALRDLLIDRQEKGFVPVRKLCPGLDARLAQIIEACLALDPDKRPASAEDLLAWLKRPASMVRRGVRWIMRRPKVLVAAVLLSAALSTALAIEIRSRRNPHEVQLGLGMEAYRAGDFARAIKHLDLALLDDSENGEAQFARGHAHMRLGREKKEHFHLARTSLLEADRLSNDGLAKACMGYCSHRLGQVDVARTHYELALEKGLRTPEFLNNISVVWYEKKVDQVTREDLLEKARRTLLEASEKSDSIQAVYHNLALVYLETAFRQSTREKKLEFFEQGIAFARKALDRGPKNTDLLADAGLLCVYAAGLDRRWVAPALDYLEEAVDLGARLEAPRKLSPSDKADARKLEGRVIYTGLPFNVLKGEARYQALLAREPRPEAYVRADRIVDVVK